MSTCHFYYSTLETISEGGTEFLCKINFEWKQHSAFGYMVDYFKMYMALLPFTIITCQRFLPYSVFHFYQDVSITIFNIICLSVYMYMRHAIRKFCIG